MDNADIKLLTERMLHQTPVLVLGAGFSRESRNGEGKLLPTARELSVELFNKFLKENKDIDNEDLVDYEGEKEDLQKTCNNLRREKLSDKRDEYLTRRFSNCRCDLNDYHMLLKSYKWNSIFDLNIDDLVEFIYSIGTSKRKYCVHVIGKSELDNSVDLQIFKPHGSVKRKDLGYIFDESEYRQITIHPNWTMGHFADLFLTNDVIFLGTEFQENDFYMMIEKYTDLVSIKEPFHYFFVSPELKNRDIKRAVRDIQNIHHIPWSTKEFLKHIKTSITDVVDLRKKMRDYGMVFYDEKKRSSISNTSPYLSELYLGNPPRPDDFFNNWDIIHPAIIGQAEAINKEECHYIVTIVGNPYVGKTCAALRLGVDLMEHGYEFSIFPLSTVTEAKTYRRLLVEYLQTLPEESKIAILAENMAFYYHYIKEVLENCPQNIKSLVFICTARIQDHTSKKYLLDRYQNLREILITENSSDPTLAKAIYKKLEERNHLNKLISYGKNEKEIIQSIKDLHDIVEVLFVAHEGRGFVKHFSGWIDNKANNSSKKGFFFLCCLERLGISNLSVRLFQDMLEKCGITFNVRDFLHEYSEIIFQDAETRTLHLRCSRLLWASAYDHLDNKFLEESIKYSASYLARNLKEREDSIQNEIFQKLIKTNAIHRLPHLPMKSISEILLYLEDSSKHLSYYWIQRGICYRNLECFEEANSALSKAAMIRNNKSFQIKHAQAKNYMAWGVWALTNQKNYASYYFDIGKDMMEDLIQNAPERYYSYSIHAYVDMMIRYHRQKNVPISTASIQYISICLQRLVNNFNDEIAQQIVKKFLQYCTEISLNVKEVQDLQVVYRRKLDTNEWKSTPLNSIDLPDDF